MSIRHLIQIEPPPATPVGIGGPHLWQQLTLQNGLSLPRDYMSYIDNYGSGGWYDEVGIYSPFFAPRGLLEEHEQMREHYTEIQARVPTRLPFPLFSAQDGLLLLGGDCDGNYLYWLCRGSPEEWPLLLYAPGYYELEQFDIPLTEWLIRWLTGELRSKLMRSVGDCQPDAPKFRPSRTPAMTYEAK